MHVPVAESGFVSSSSGLKAMGVNASKTAKLFHMMSSTLYTDKSMSILRELSSNARDSHAEAGKLDTPFAVIAPSQDYLFLTVSDAGTGITYEKACTSILEFLSSTKDEGETADNFIGGWGIGAKVPRAYTDNYQVFLRKGGIEWVVQVVNDAAGLPQQMLMSEHKTDKPDGVDFHVPIQPIHVNQWREKVRRYVSVTNYNVIGYMGAGEVIYPQKPYRSYDFGFFALDVRGGINPGHPKTTHVDVIYGGMVYQIPYEFNTAALQKSITDRVKTGLSLHIRLDTPNAVKCGLSREQLEVDEPNKNLILKALMLVEDELRKAAVEMPGIRDGMYMCKWKDVEALSDTIRKAIKENADLSKLSAISSAKQYSVTWCPKGLLEDTYKGSTDTVKSSSKKYTLPLDVDHREVVHVKYSDKIMLRSDMANAGGRFKIEYPNKTTDEGEVRKWANSLEDYEGVDLTFEYVESTRSTATRGKGSGVRVNYAICDATNKRVELSRYRTVLALPSKSYMWIGEAVSCGVFVPKKSFRLKDATEGAIMTFEEFKQTNTWTKVKEQFECAKVGWQLKAELSKPLKYLELKDYWPAGFTEEVEGVRKQLEELAEKMARRAVRLETLESEFGKQNLTYVNQEATIDHLLKQANRMIVRIAYEDDLYKVVDVDTVLREYKEGNPEATRLMWAMRLEQYL